MARRKRKEEELIWEPPEFDEVGYMRKEIENAKIALVVIAWAAVGAFLAYLLYSLNEPVVGFLIGIFAFGFLYFLLPLLGLPIHGFKRRDWLSHASVYFFSWLAFSILFLNAPFGDHTSPVVGSFQVGTFGATGNQTVPAAGTLWCTPASPGETLSVHTGGTNKSIYLIFRATDNVAVQSVTVTVSSGTITANVAYASLAGAEDLCAGAGLAPFSIDTYGLAIPIAGPQYIVTVTAVDTSQLTTVASVVLQPVN